MDLTTFAKQMQLTPVSLDTIQEDPRFSDDYKQCIRDFKAQVQAGDTVYHYDSYPEEWARLMGSEGYILVRDGQIVDSLVVKMN